MTTDPKLRRKIQIKYEELLEKAFDNEVDDVVQLLTGDPKLPLEPNYSILPEGTYSPLSEAAAGNATDVVAMLLSRGADPNHIGQHNRTPIYRACFNEHVEVLPILLEGGADPRKLLPQQYVEVTDDEGEVEEEDPVKAKKMVEREWDPDEIPVAEGVKKILRTWDIQKTKKMMEGRERGGEEMEIEVQIAVEKMKTDQEGLEHEVEIAVEAWKQAMRVREARTLEHDTAKCEGRHDAALCMVPLIEAAERETDELRVLKDTLEQKLSKIKGMVRKNEIDRDGLHVSSRIQMGSLPDVVNDASGEISSTGKCALLIDPSGKAAAFLKYRNVVMVDLHNPMEMREENFIDTLLGSVKQCRTLILDIGTDSDDRCLETTISELNETLYPLITTTTLTTQAAYEYLITPQLLRRSPDLDPTKFPSDCMQWRFMVLTRNQYPQASLLETFYSILVE